MNVWCVGRCEELRAFLGEGGEVETCSREEIFRLSNVHPEALQVKRVQLPICADGRKCFLFNGCRAQVDALQHAWIENIDAGVNAISDELDRLLDESVNARGVIGFVHYDTVLRGFFNLSHDYCSLLTVRFMEGGEVRERVVADDIGIQDEERCIVFAQGFFCELQRASSTQGFRFD